MTIVRATPRAIVSAVVNPLSPRGLPWEGGGGGAAPEPPVISGTVSIGEVLTSTSSGQWYRDAVAISGETGSTYTVVSADIGPDITQDNAAGTSNTLVYDDATDLPFSAIGVSTSGLTLADANTTVQSWASSLGGIAVTLSAAAAANRPAYSATGGVGSRPLVTFDGIASASDALTGAMTKGSAWATYEMGIVGRRVAFTDAGDWAIVYDEGGFARFGIQDGSSTTERFQIGTAAPATTTNPETAPAHLSGDAASGTVNMRVAGTVEGTASATVTSRTDGGSVCLGARVNASLGSNVAVQAWYAGPSLTAGQRANLRGLLTYHTGVAC